MDKQNNKLAINGSKATISVDDYSNTVYVEIENPNLDEITKDLAKHMSVECLMDNLESILEKLGKSDYVDDATEKAKEILAMKFNAEDLDALFKSEILDFINIFYTDYFFQHIDKALNELANHEGTVEREYIRQKIKHHFGLFDATDVELQNHVDKRSERMKRHRVSDITNPIMKLDLNDETDDD